LAPSTFGGLTAAANGTTYYCSDCKALSVALNTCLAGGTGALAVRINGVWKCFQ